MILVPLITIQLQLLDDCKTLGLNAIAGSQVNTWSFPPTPPRNFFLTDTETLFNLKRRFPWPILNTKLTSKNYSAQESVNG